MTAYGNPAYRRPAPRPALLDGLLLITLALLGCVFLWRSLRRTENDPRAWADVLALQLLEATVRAVYGAIVGRAG
jgi:hypothetical protein